MTILQLQSQSISCLASSNLQMSSSRNQHQNMNTINHYMFHVLPIIPGCGHLHQTLHPLPSWTEWVRRVKDLLPQLLQVREPDSSEWWWCLYNVPPVVTWPPAVEPSVSPSPVAAQWGTVPWSVTPPRLPPCLAVQEFVEREQSLVWWTHCIII